jgi:hypothetical protein
MFFGLWRKYTQMARSKKLKNRLRDLLPTEARDIFDQAPDPQDEDFLKSMVAYSWAQEVRMMGLMETAKNPIVMKILSTQIISLRTDRSRLIQLYRVAIKDNGQGGDTYMELFPEIDDSPPRSL